MKGQERWIKQQLRENGRVTRNEAVRNYITRLGAYIVDLKHAGWKIKKGRYTEDRRDFVYELESAPIIRKVEIINGRPTVVTEQKTLI